MNSTTLSQENNHPLLRADICTRAIRSSLVAAITATIICSSVSVSAGELDPEKCYRVAVGKDLPLITSGVTTADGALLLEAFKQPMVRIDALGRFENHSLPLPQQIATKTLGEASPVWTPFQIHRSGNQYYILYRQSQNSEYSTQPWFRVFVLNEHLENPRPINIDYDRMLISDFEPLPGHGIVLYGKFRQVFINDAGFLYFDFTSQKGDGIYRVPASEGETNSIEHVYYANLNFRIMASLNNKVYILLFKREGVSIGVFDPSFSTSGLREEIAVPLEFRDTHFPDDSDTFLNAGGRKQTTILQRIVERNRFVTGIFSFKNAIHILVKSQMSMNGKVDWWLIPVTGEDRTPIPLPVHSAHLSVIEDEAGFWRLIERDRVEEVGELREPYTRALAITLTVPRPEGAVLDGSACTLLP